MDILRQRVPFFFQHCSGYYDIVNGTSPLLLPKAKANSLQYVKAFGGTEQRDIPDNYLQRQYIYMVEGSYIKIEDLPISAGYRVEYDFQTTTLQSQLRNYIGGRANGVSAGGGFRLSKLASGGTTLNRVVLYGFEEGTEYYDPTVSFQSNTRYKYTYNNGVCTLESGGNVVSTRTFTVTDNTSTKWGINTYVSGNDSWQTESAEGVYAYSLKVWNDQDELVMDLVPAVQKGTVLVVGFYDTVSKTFKTASAGTFMAGPEAVPTPDTPMDIISNNGVLKVDNQGNIYTDGTMETVEVLGKNLINQNLNVVGKGIASDGSEASISSVYAHTAFIKVLPNTTYTMSGLGTIGTVLSKRGAEYSTDNFSSFVKSIEKTANTFTTSANTNFICLNTEVSETQQMLEQGSTATTYEPYYNGGTATAEILLKVGDYQDVQSIIDGEVTRNTAVLVLTGTEAWGAGSSGTGYRKMSLPLTNVGATGTDSAGLCTHYKCEYANTVGNFYFSSDGTLQMVVSSNETVTGFKNFLANQYAAGTPVIVVYTLAASTTESVAGQTLQVQAGTNTLAITQASLDDLTLEAEYKRGR